MENALRAGMSASGETIEEARSSLVMGVAVACTRVVPEEKEDLKHSLEVS